MTKVLLATLVAAMLVLTGLVAFNTASAPDPNTPSEVTATVTESSDGACPLCTKEADAACCDEAAKPGCCKGDAAVKPGAAAPKGDDTQDTPKD